jgi:HlyD family secretion protein
VGYTVVSNLQSSTLFLIGKDMTSMQVDTNVSEADVGEVHDGQKANFTVQAFPNRTFEATVRQVRKGPITVQNVVTYDVVLDVQNKDLALLPGMTSDTHIVTAERKNVLRVPLPATRFVPEGMGRGGGERGAAGADEQPRRQRPPRASDSGDQSGATEGHRGPAEGRREPSEGKRDSSERQDAAGPGRRVRGPRAMARIWVLRNGKLTPVVVRTGLDDGTLIEVSSEDLKEGDEVVVNAVRPNAPRPTAGERPSGAGQGQPNPGRAGGAGFRL